MATPVLSPEGTLLLPVERLLRLPPHRIQIAATPALPAFYPKTELHLTIFGYATGRLVRAACAEDPALEAWINTMADAMGQAHYVAHLLAPGAAWYVLTREPLHTLILLVRPQPHAAFYAAVAARTTHAPLKARLAIVPPAHVTCYTTDPAGKAGIGVNSDDDLKPDGPLRAVRLKGL